MTIKWDWSSGRFISFTGATLGFDAEDWGLSRNGDEIDRGFPDSAGSMGNGRIRSEAGTIGELAGNEIGWIGRECQ